MSDLQIPYDPDFDDDQNAVKTSGPSPRLAFIAGLIMSVLSMATIGFFILLVFLFR